MGHSHGVDSEAGRLRSALLHRPGAELTRITPRSRRQLLLPRRPWLARAQEEHDAFAQALRDHGVAVLYLTELLQDVLEYQQARSDAITSVLADEELGDDLRGRLSGYLHGLDPEELARVLIAGLTEEEFPGARGLVHALLERGEFVVEPLPNLVFTRDSSAWLGDGVAIASLPRGARGREPVLSQVVYDHHPQFAGVQRVCGPGPGQLAAGDLLQLAPGATAVGIGPWTSPAGAERLARRLFETGLSQSVLVVPTARHGISACLDTLCTVAGAGTLLMHPGLAYSLTAHLVTPRPDGIAVSRPQPFLEAAARVMGVDAVTLIGTGTGPFAAGPDPAGEDGAVLVLGPRLVVSQERNVQVNARLEAAGIEVIRVPGSELCGVRGGPRCLSCPVGREAVSVPDELPAAVLPLTGPRRGTRPPAGGRGQSAAACPPQRPAAIGAAAGTGGRLAPAR